MIGTERGSVSSVAYRRNYRGGLRVIRRFVPPSIVGGRTSSTSQRQGRRRGAITRPKKPFLIFRHKTLRKPAKILSQEWHNIHDHQILNLDRQTLPKSCRLLLGRVF